MGRLIIHSNIISNMFFEKKKFTIKSCDTCDTDRKHSNINVNRADLCHIGDGTQMGQ